MEGGETLSFELKFATGKDSQQITASWPDPKHAVDNVPLNFGKLASALGADISNVPAELIPTLKKLKFDYEFREKRLLLAAETETVTLAFLTAPTGGDKKSLVAFGLKAGPISTKKALSASAVGSALEPYGIALDGLTILAAANAKATNLKLKLGDQEEPISQGLLLKGLLRFEGTSFSYPFDCNLGGEKELAAKEGGTGVGPGVATGGGKTTQIEEGGNNVRVGRKIGPLTFRKVRFESRDKRVYVLIDASLGGGGFDLDLDGFNLNFPLSVLSDPSKLLSDLGVGLEGMSVSYSNPPLMIAGGFSCITKPAKPYVELFEGHLLIKAKAFQISVLGSYGTILVNEKKEASLFVYGMYDGVIGGPPAFYVTGLALGGGYNTRLALPPIEKVAEFPLVKAVTTGLVKSDDVRKAVLPSYGDYWLALGVRFSSFEMVQAFALLSVSFGNELEIGLLGLAALTVPDGRARSPAVPTTERSSTG
jgi:hypothetical protein